MDQNPGDSTGEEKQGDPLLIELVAQFPCLYNKQLQEYRNLNFREGAWNAIGRVMNMLPSECSKRWGQLRESFARENRRREDESRSGSGLSQRRGFSLYQDMKFLEPHYKKRRTFSNVAHMQKNQVMHRSNTGSTINYAPTPPDRTNDIEWCRQYMPACIPTSFSNARSSVDLITTRVADTSPLIPPPDSTPAATFPPMTEISPVISTPLLSYTGSHTTPPIETTSVVDLHPVSNTPVSVSSMAMLTRPHPPMSVPAALGSAMTPITHLLTTSTPISPATTITPVSAPLQTILSSLPGSDTSTPPPPLTMPTPPRTPTPSYYSASPSASISASTYASESPISSPSSPVLGWPINEQFDLTRDCSHIDKPPSCAIPSRSNISNNRITPKPQSLTSTSTSVLGSHSFAEPSTCYNKKLKKQDKNDPVETSFLRLSSVIEEHLINRTKVMETRTKPVTTNNDEAFVSLILAELANCDDEKKIAKKAKILQVLYEK